MVQITDCWSACCPCPAPWRKALPFPAARTSSRDDDESKLLPRRPKASKEAHGGDNCNSISSMLQLWRPLSHLQGLDGEINQVVRLVLVGSCDTGKTCLFRRFIGGHFDKNGHQDYNRTLGVDFGCKTVELTDLRVRVQIWDTGGIETYRSVLSHYLRGANGIVLCFDINRMGTLRDLRTVWAPYVDTHAPRTCRVLLVGNKADVCPDREGSSNNLIWKEAKRVAEAIDAQLFETSSRLGINIDVAILALMREVLHHRQYSARGSVAGGAVAIRSERLPLSEALREELGDISSGGNTVSPRNALREKNKSVSNLKNRSLSPWRRSDQAATCRGNFNEPGGRSSDPKDKDDRGGGGAIWRWPLDGRQSITNDEGSLRGAGGDSAGGDSAGGNRAGVTSGHSATRNGTKIVQGSMNSGEDSWSVGGRATARSANVYSRSHSEGDSRGALAKSGGYPFTREHHGAVKNRSRGHALSKPITISPSVLRMSKTPIIVSGVVEASLPFKGVVAASAKASELVPLEARKYSTHEVDRSRRLMSRSESWGAESLSCKETKKNVSPARSPHSLHSTDSPEVTVKKRQGAFSAPRERGRGQFQGSGDSVTMVDTSDVSSLSDPYSFTTT